MTLGLALMAQLTVASAAGDLPPALRSVLLLAAVGQDTAFAKHHPAAITVVVTYAAENLASETCAKDMQQAFAGAGRKGIRGRKVRAVKVAYGAGLKAELSSRDASVLYVCPGLQSHLARILSMTRGQKVVSLASTRAQVRAGVSLGAFRRPNGKPGFVVNLRGSRAEGARFSLEFLQLAEVVQ